jgi:hypothetical protein
MKQKLHFMLYQRWRTALRNRQLGGDGKPARAALAKIRGGERRV